MLDLSTLNTAQREAVLTTEGPLLVLAGAGSGKTRVLTYRIAHLIQDCAVSPWSIMAVTFTNKAASEMRQRLEALLGGSTRGMWISTFHSMCVRILRSEAALLGYTERFTIYDTPDSKRLVKDILTELGYHSKSISEAAVRNRISAAKNDLVGSHDFTPRLADPLDKVVKEVYPIYMRRLKRADAMDFDDLLFNVCTLLYEHEDIRAEYAQRFRYLMIDEYQDTNRAQYQISRLLAQGHRNIMVVGDDDQSIYSWRGADIRNILDFERDWPDAVTIKLEQNYRSTSTILDAANAVIAHNTSRKEKRLFCEGNTGDKIALYLAADERDEGRWLASQVERLHDRGEAYRGMAVFYRTNAQSRTLEDMFLRAGVPYRIVGGTRFFDRSEIRDVTAYLRLALNAADDASCMRIINTPRRGIGKTTIERISSTAALHDLSFFEAVREETADPSNRASTRKALGDFTALIDEMSAFAGSLEDVVEMVIERSGLISALETQRSDDSASRLENISEFKGVVHDYCETHELVADASSADVEEGYHEPTLMDFMEWLALRTDLDALDEADEYVTFMTVHSAKGLEFDNVFVAGLEEGIFPHRASVEEHGVEEERRLAYVAITRARKRLFMSHAQTRRIFNDMQANPRSRFIDEIPDTLIAREGIGSMGMTGTGWEKRGDRRGTYGSGRGEEMYGGRVYGKGGPKASSADSAQMPVSSDTFSAGDTVEHKVFGRGTVVAVDADKLTVRFSKSGKVKKLLMGYAPIVKVRD